MSRILGAVPVTVDALIPSLGSLSVNNVTTPSSVAIEGKRPSEADPLEKEEDDIEGDRVLEEEEEDPGNKPKDTGTNKGVEWVVNGKFNEKAHKRFIHQRNEDWAKYYPPKENVLQPEKHSYESWTSFFPSGKNLKTRTPHWLNDKWPKETRETLSQARLTFYNHVENSLRPLEDPEKINNPQKATQAEKDIQERQLKLARLKTILTNDGETDDQNDLTASRNILSPMFQQRGVFGQYKRKRGVTFPLPPGWLMIHKQRGVDKIKAALAKSPNKSPGTLSDPSYVGPNYKSYATKPPDSVYDVVLQDSPVQAWLVYLMYQNSSKTFDEGNQARAKPAKKQKQEGSESGANDESAGNDEEKLDDEMEGGESGAQDKDDKNHADDQLHLEIMKFLTGA